MPASAPQTPPFATVFQEHAPRVWRALRRLGVPESDVEDVCQEVFVVVHRKLPSFEGRSALSTWIYGIATRVASDYRKKAYVRRERPTDEVPDERRSAPQLKELEREQARQLLDEALSALSDDKRAVFVLYEIEEQSMPSIAETLKLPVQTAYSRLYAARREVESAVRARMEGGTA
ncbi:MAG: RNA polymerase sigma factor [Sandaracinaceae bacterium]